MLAPATQSISHGRGAVSAGHEATAAAGAEILARGGNAVDAVVAMTIAASVTEGTLTSLGGGGFILVSVPGSQPVLLDCFVRQPGHGLNRPLAPWQAYSLQLENTVLSFGIGPASVAVPLLPAGLAEASKRFGSISLRAAAEPALELATTGVVITPSQAAEHELNIGMVTQNADGAEIFLNEAGTSYQAGEVLRQPALARSIELLAATDARTFYEGEIAKNLVAWSDLTGGRITIDDLRSAVVIERAPISVDLGEAYAVATPAPSMGGKMTLELLRDIRGYGFSTDGHQFPGIDAQVGFITRQTVERQEPPATVPPQAGAPVLMHDIRDEPLSTSPNTTHVSAIDASGMMASATSSVGFGSGEYIPGTGIQLNNMLAEYGHDLPRTPGTPSPSMMTPMFLLGKTTSVSIGSAGANRIPQALSQITSRLLDGDSLEEAIHAPRFIWDGSVLHAEPGHDERSLAWLRENLEVNEWPAIDAYFGTSNGAAARHGSLHATGDPRRSGLGIVVD